MPLKSKHIFIILSKLSLYYCKKRKTIKDAFLSSLQARLEISRGGKELLNKTDGRKGKKRLVYLSSLSG